MEIREEVLDGNTVTVCVVGDGPEDTVMVDTGGFVTAVSQPGTSVFVENYHVVVTQAGVVVALVDRNGLDTREILATYEFGPARCDGCPVEDNCPFGNDPDNAYKVTDEELNEWVDGYVCDMDKVEDTAVRRAMNKVLDDLMNAPRSGLDD